MSLCNPVLSFCSRRIEAVPPLRPYYSKTLNDIACWTSDCLRVLRLVYTRSLLCFSFEKLAVRLSVWDSADMSRIVMFEQQRCLYLNIFIASPLEPSKSRHLASCWGRIAAAALGSPLTRFNSLLASTKREKGRSWKWFVGKSWECGIPPLRVSRLFPLCSLISFKQEDLCNG